jgi:prepilin-type N-terminal cleavage/methylation domain-containing protein
MKPITMARDAQRGFTLLEILLVVAAIAILAGIVIVAINPGRQLGETRNAQRKVDVRTILSAIQQYQLRTGALPANIPGGSECAEDESQEICATGAPSCSGLIDLSVLTEDQAYLTSIPVDPAGSITADGRGSGYMAYVNASNRVTVCAYQAELEETISITQ